MSEKFYQQQRQDDLLTINRLRQALRLAVGPSSGRGAASPCNYTVYSGTSAIADGLSRDQAIGFAEGLAYASVSQCGSPWNPSVRCGAWVCWPEDRYGEIIAEEA